MKQYLFTYKKGGCICDTVVVVVGLEVDGAALVLGSNELITSPVEGYVYRKTKGTPDRVPFTFALFIHN